MPGPSHRLTNILVVLYSDRMVFLTTNCLSSSDAALHHSSQLKTRRQQLLTHGFSVGIFEVDMRINFKLRPE